MMNPVADLKVNPNTATQSGTVQGGAAAATASAKSTTRAGTTTDAPTKRGVFNASPGMPGLFQSHFDFMMARNFCAGAYGDGGAAGECFSTARRIVDRDVESWTVAWSDTAERVERIAKDCLSGGHALSAREAFLRASMYWGSAFFYLAPTDPRHLEMYMRHRSCFRQAARLFNPAIEPVSIPYENGKTLPGYFMRAEGADGPRPTVMIITGGDGTCEELYFWGGGAAAVRRGYNAFLWEGPGQVGAYTLDPELTYRPDWEVPTRYAVDYVLSRDDVDPERLALSGHSMSGYFVPRAAAYEKRLTAVIANSLLPEWKPAAMVLMGFNPGEPYGADLESRVNLSDMMIKWFATQIKVRMGNGGDSVAAFFDKCGAYSLAGLEGKITCPLLSIAGEAEGPLMLAMGHEFYEKLTCPKAEHVVSLVEGGEAHCTMNNPSLKHQIEFDWLDDVFKQ